MQDLKLAAIGSKILCNNGYTLVVNNKQNKFLAVSRLAIKTTFNNPDNNSVVFLHVHEQKATTSLAGKFQNLISSIILELLIKTYKRNITIHVYAPMNSC